MPEPCVRSAHTPKPLDLPGRVTAFDQRLANQQGVIASRLERRSISPVTNTRLRYPNHALRHLRSHPNRSLLIHLEGHQVSLVHPDQVAPDSQGTFEFALIVDLDQGIEPELLRQVVQVSQLSVVEGGRDQQHTIRAHQPSIDNIAGIDGEVLANHRQIGRRTGGLEVSD